MVLLPRPTKLECVNKTPPARWPQVCFSFTRDGAWLVNTVTPSHRVTRLRATLYFLWPWSLHCSQAKGRNQWPDPWHVQIRSQWSLTDALGVFPENCLIVVWADDSTCCVTLRCLLSLSSSSFCLCFQPVAERGERERRGMVPSPQTRGKQTQTQQRAATPAAAACARPILSLSLETVSLSLSAQTLPNTALYRQI